LSSGRWYNNSDIGSGGTLIINPNALVYTTSTHVFDAGGVNPLQINGAR